MPTIALRRLLVVTTTAFALACASDDVMAPTAEEAALEPIELSLDRIDRGEAAPADADRSVPTLQRLLHEAIVRVRAERGDAAARRLLEPLRDLLREAREAREAGDRETARRKLREANLVAARIVVRVFGTQVAPRLDSRVTEQLVVLHERIAETEAEGGDATRLRRAAEAVQSLQTTASRLMDAGAHPRAVVVLSHALDLLRAALAHG